MYICNIVDVEIKGTDSASKQVDTPPVSDHVLSKLYHGYSPLKVPEGGGLSHSVLSQIEHALRFFDEVSPRRNSRQ